MCSYYLAKYLADNIAKSTTDFFQNWNHQSWSKLRETASTICLFFICISFILVYQLLM